jgi:hypothetical protein
MSENKEIEINIASDNDELRTPIEEGKEEHSTSR